MRPISFERAKAQYPHRFTLEHVPQWAKNQAPNGLFYAPQYSTDKEWYDNTNFPGEAGIGKKKTHCFSSKPSWPMGQWLNEAYKP